MELIGDGEVSSAENRKRATKALQAFPEAAALSADELAAAADRVVAEYVQPRDGDVGGPGDGPADGQPDNTADRVGVNLVAKIRVDLLTRGYFEAPDRPAAEDI